MLFSGNTNTFWLVNISMHMHW